MSRQMSYSGLKPVRRLMATPKPRRRLSRCSLKRAALPLRTVAVLRLAGGVYALLGRGLLSGSLMRLLLPPLPPPLL
jgi:hypothetical protein